MISEIRKGVRANSAVVSWFENNYGAGYFLSSMVIGEIRKGIVRLEFQDPVSAAKLDGWLEETCRLFQGRIIGVDAEIAKVWGEISAKDPPPAIDGLMAATAIARDLTLVTRNEADVKRTGVRYLNPFG